MGVSKPLPPNQFEYDDPAHDESDLGTIPLSPKISRRTLAPSVPNVGIHSMAHAVLRMFDSLPQPEIDCSMQKTAAAVQTQEEVYLLIDELAPVVRFVPLFDNLLGFAQPFQADTLVGNVARVRTRCCTSSRSSKSSFLSYRRSIKLQRSTDTVRLFLVASI